MPAEKYPNSISNPSLNLNDKSLRGSRDIINKTRVLYAVFHIDFDFFKLSLFMPGRSALHCIHVLVACTPLTSCFIVFAMISAGFPSFYFICILCKFMFFFITIAKY